MHCCEQKWWCMNKPLYITSDSYRASFHLTMHRLHGCTCWLLVAYTVRHASTGIPIGCVTYFLTTCSTPLMPALGKGFSTAFSHDLCQHASNTSVPTSTFSKLSCFTLAYMYDKAKHALMLVQACLLYIHFTTPGSSSCWHTT